MQRAAANFLGARRYRQIVCDDEVIFQRSTARHPEGRERAIALGPIARGFGVNRKKKEQD